MGILNTVVSISFWFLICSFKEFAWIKKYDEDSYELNSFRRLFYRIEQMLQSLTKNETKSLFPEYDFDIDRSPWSYIKYSTALILIELRYNHWNQYYYENMSNDCLYELVLLKIKQQCIKNKLNKIDEDFQ